MTAEFDCPHCKKKVQVKADAEREPECPTCGRALEEPPRPVERMKRCPMCGEEILAIARKCKHCGEVLVAPKPIREGGMGPGLGVLFALVLIGAIFLFSNPSEAKHKQAVYAKLRSIGVKEGGFSGFAWAVGMDISQDLDVFPFEYHNYLLFSTMTYRGERVSSGVLGRVFVNE